MPEHDRSFDADLLKSLTKQVRLFVWSPSGATGARAMAEARPIEGDDSIPLSCKIDQTAGLEILNHGAVTVKQKQRAAPTPLHIV